MHPIGDSTQRSIRERSRAHFVGRRSERDLLASALVASAAEPRIVLLRGEAGVGKTTLLRIFSWEAEDAGHRVMWVSGEHVLPNPEAVTAHVGGALQSREPWAELGARDKVDILVLDAAENLWPCLSWVFGEALSRLERRVLVIVASRSSMPPNLRAQIGFAASMTDVHLPTFSKSELLSAIEARGLPVARTAEIERGCAASPLAFALLAEHYARTGALPSAQSAADPWVVLSQEFLRNATTASQASALRALSVSRVVDPELLASMLGVEDALPLFRFLAELSFVDETPRGLILHGVVRRSVYEDLRTTQPKLLAEYVERAIDLLSTRASESPLSSACDLVLEAFFLARQSNNARSFLFLEDLGRHSVRHAREEDLSWIRQSVDHFEGAQSRATFEEILPLQRDALFVVADENDEPESVFFAIDAARLPSDIIARDETLRLAIEHTQSHQPLVARYWFVRDTYQAFGPKMTALMCSGPPLLMHVSRRSELVFAVEDPERWKPLGPLWGLEDVEGVRIRFPNHIKGLSIANLDRMTHPSLSWRERHRQIFRIHARNLAELSASTPGAWLGHEAFVEAVREALSVLRRPLELAETRLLDCALATTTSSRGPESSPSAAIAQVLKEALDELESSAAYAADAGVLRATFFGPPEKHEAIAASLGLPFGTFRHRVRRATARLAELLWRRELAARL